MSCIVEHLPQFSPLINIKQLMHLMLTLIYHGNSTTIEQMKTLLKLVAYVFFDAGDLLLELAELSPSIAHLSHTDRLQSCID